MYVHIFVAHTCMYTYRYVFRNIFIYIYSFTLLYMNPNILPTLYLINIFKYLYNKFKCTTLLLIFLIGWSLVMTLWAMFNVHETMNLSLEYVNEVFGASTWEEYFQYSYRNFSYTFYFGNKTMLEYTQEGKIEFKKLNKDKNEITGEKSDKNEHDVAYHQNPLGSNKPMSRQNEDNFHNEV